MTGKGLGSLAQLVGGAVLLMMLERAEQTGAPVSAQGWYLLAQGAGHVAAAAGRVRIAAESRYYDLVSP